jgi:hypothetical protein
VNEQGSGKATHVQVAGLWIAACSLALALLRIMFDVLEGVALKQSPPPAGSVRRAMFGSSNGKSLVLTGTTSALVLGNFEKA